jgi:hypothetical protein
MALGWSSSFGISNSMLDCTFCDRLRIRGSLSAVPIYLHGVVLRHRHNFAFTFAFLFTTAFRTALGPTQPPIQWIPGALSLGVKRQGREADHSPSSNAEVKEWVELYLHSPCTPGRVCFSCFQFIFNENMRGYYRSCKICCFPDLWV